MFTGSIVALLTPMDKAGKVCKHSLKTLINYHIMNGTSAIVSLGTTGEVVTLTDIERHDVVLLTLEIANGRIPIIVGTGVPSTTAAVVYTQRLENLGVSACLTVTPYYNCPTQEGLYQHFKTIAENTNLPQILYNIPLRTGVDLLPSTIERLVHFKNIIGIKDATGNLSRVTQLQQLLTEDFMLFSGDDSTALDFIKLGGHGVISVTANIAARQMAQICALSKRGNFSEASLLNQQLMTLHHALFIESNPIPVKWAAQRLGLIETDTLRLPMTPLTHSSRAVMEKALQNAQLISVPRGVPYYG
ncbi:4-hydroxy-tetrahydrodipicolinate synthase [Candidatus Erwinia haradaeae]|uniref:4-hydroxy-tetrahydrodipicolinate synthase n=1 Tax=Candidatus Erwinia haradaeae TaxID=1922217 RepID=A0A451D965_9GAMM|nr:4-hydroxy-tetrahydrodipicolinate synthase [Candidatus Erwinia haradaeae]VFP82806.1 4-hydroxy-tetrahydrodipicolinate synthase [Candidatus Erwinia haradaeae]